METKKHSFIIALSLATFLPATSYALTGVSLTGFGGTYFQTGEKGLLGGELTYRVIPTGDVGGFYEYSLQENSDSYSIDQAGVRTPYTVRWTRNAYGVVARFTLPWADFFADVRAGAHSTSDGTNSYSGIYSQGGLGYAYSPAPWLTISPRLAILLAATQSQYSGIALNGSLLISVRP